MSTVVDMEVHIKVVKGVYDELVAYPGVQNSKI